MNTIRLVLFLLALSPCTLPAQTESLLVEMHPGIIGVEQGAIQNAGCGWEIWRGGPSNGDTRLLHTAVEVSPYAVNAMIRVNWSDYETDEGRYHFAKMDEHFKHAIRYGQKLNIGCFVTSDNHGLTIDGALCAYPRYVHQAMQRSEHKDVKHTNPHGGVTRWEPNFENPYFVERYKALLAAFAEYLNGSQTVDGRTVPRKQLVRYIEMRHFGFWGEGAYPKALVPSNSECLIRLADAFLAHFPDIRLLAPTNGMVYAPATYDAIKDYHFHLLTAANDAGPLGLFRDNWGWDERLDYVQKLFYAANEYEKDGLRLYELLRDRWRVAPVVGEPIRAVPSEGFHPYSQLVDQVTYLRPVVIRNCNVSDGTKSSANPTGYNALDDPRAIDQFHKMYAIIGFRYLFTTAWVAWEDDELSIAIDWLNIGLAPTYATWTVRYFIEDPSGEEIWSGDSTLDLRTVLPAEDTPPGVIDTARATTHSDGFTGVPLSGCLSLEIVDPSGISPPMALSIRGRTPRGSYVLTPGE